MTANEHDGPQLGEIEISLFGPGYGEAIALHFGDGAWILVDSCIEPDSGLPASLHYLMRLGVDVQNAVKIVVATHWHDDHIRGISALFDACQSAELVIPGALRQKELSHILRIERGPVRSSGTDEVVKLVQCLEARRIHKARFVQAKLAHADRRIYGAELQLASETVEAEVFTLSPSDASELQAQFALAQLLPTGNQPMRRIMAPSPNHASVVLWITVGQHRVLLGADLERTADPNMGWSAILNGSTVITGKAAAFKIPHHGSENAHHELVWSQLLSEHSFAILSPFRNGRQLLPGSADVERISGLTPRAYITAPPRRRETRWRYSAVRKLIEEVTRDMQTVHYGWGQIRLRQKIEDPNSTWQVALFGDARLLSS